jgi:[acyl-carrier-protein] S-malonyltransferase
MLKGKLNIMNKIAFLFPGQGSQYIGMGKKLCEEFPVAKYTFEEANEVLNFDLQRLCFRGSLEELTKTENTQPAILTASIAAFRVYMQEIGILPENTAGHSLGEISALSCAGVIKFDEALRIVRLRGKYMQEAVPYGCGSMAAVSGIDKVVIEKECEKITKENHIVVISNYNSVDQIVISGHTKAVAEAEEILKTRGARVIQLKVSAPFHSPLMQQAADRFREELVKITSGKVMWPVISNVTAEPYPDGSSIIEYLSLQIVKPVMWQSSMAFINKSGVNIAIEMGPQAILKNLMKKNVTSIDVCSLESVEDVKKLSEELVNGTKKDENTIKNGLKFLTKCIAISVCTKNRNWDNDLFREGVIDPYEKIKSMKDELVRSGRQASLEQLKEALFLLKKILKTKITPVDEKIEWFNQLFDETETKNIFKDFSID